MTLAVMLRATLGHTGHALRAGWAARIIFAAVILAALLRLAAVCVPSVDFLMPLSGVVWALAFLSYVLFFGGMLIKPRQRSAPAA
jgi:uncharacterized protein involved in response to NO